MDAQTCLEKMKLVGTLAMATVDECGCPQIRCVSAVHYEPDAVYFLTAQGKEMAKQLERDGHLQTMVHTRFNEMIRMSGVAKRLPAEESAKWVNVIFDEQPYLANVYPGDTRNICIVFRVESIVLDYFNLGVRPIERGLYTLEGEIEQSKGYRITDACIGCGTCLSHCPQRCIVEGETYRIQPEHCLHCGACFANCPAHAVERLG